MLFIYILQCLTEASSQMRQRPRNRSISHHFTRKTARIDGDIMIGCLFPIHEQPTLNSTRSRKCGAVREQYGIQRIEALVKAVREINDDHTILPNITLGLDIRDTCWYAPIALEQSIDFIRNALTYMENEGRCMEQFPTNYETIKSVKLQHCLDEAVGVENKPIASLIGPGSSHVSMQVQNLLQLFKIPQIGYSATAMELSRTDEYAYFLRLVPPDSFQAQVIFSLIQQFNWSYVSLVHSEGK
ncbi:unnamed protein product [Protopolystoma xenopodis]|uniref:Receptor ligand binding region domain-containing protein n=1 Tax=Protopolystoma xenopodis TaxID=117903 RepID=A0A3S5AKH1_9PLAT|nr:unnamed protein product [Protopolystoma xenopodis]